MRIVAMLSNIIYIQPIVIVFLKSGAKVQQKNGATKKAAPKSISKK